MSYTKKLKDPRWQRKRLEIFKRDKWCCKLCKDTETTLNVHHIEYIDGAEPWEYPNSMLQTLCEHCHFEVERNIRAGEETYGIYKSNNWTSNSRIMFTLHSDSIGMTIYDGNDKFIVGFNFCSDLPELSKLIKKALKNGKS